MSSFTAHTFANLREPTPDLVKPQMINVDLGSLTDPHHVAEAVATSLRFSANSKDPSLELADRVRSLKLLIILDSREQPK